MANLIRAIINYIFLSGRAHSKGSKFYQDQKENIILKSEDSGFFGAYVIDNGIKPNENTNFFVVLHGKGTDRHDATRHVKLKSFGSKNSIFTVVDVRGFGESTASFSREGANQDIHATFEYVQKRFKPKKIYLIGHSYGAALSLAYSAYALENKKSIQPAKIFLFAPFENLSLLLHDKGPLKTIFTIMPFMEDFLFSELEYENKKVVAKLQDKVTIFHGRRDETIPPEHSERMAKDAKKVKAYFTNDTHDGVFENKVNWDKLFNEIGGNSNETAPKIPLNNAPAEKK